MSVGAAPAGSVEDVQLLAGRLHDVGVESWEAGRRLAGVRAGGWVGEAARAFDAAAADVPPQLDRAGEAFAGASLALRAYAFELAQAQDAARRAAVLWADAEAASAAWRRSLEDLADDDPRRSSADPGVGGRVTAQRLYDDALAELEVVAQRTAARLREAADVAPDAPGLWTQVWNAGKSFAGGVWDGATGIADLALHFNPVRLALDPDGFARDAKQLADGLWYAVTNPGEVVNAFIQAFKDDPARAFGEMLPGLLMGPAALGAAGKVANQLTDVAKQLPGRMRQMPALLSNDRGSATIEALTLGILRLPVAVSWRLPESLDDHFARHGKDFGASSAEEYAQMAADFLSRALVDGLPVKIDNKGVIRAFDPQSGTFAAYNPDGTTRTFYKPKAGAKYWDKQAGVAPWSP